LSFRCDRERYRETVRSEISNPSFNSSPWMRGAPQGFSRAMVWMAVRTSRAVIGLPTSLLRDRKRQYKRKPFRCQRTTVSGFTISSGLRQFGHSRRQCDPEQSVGMAQTWPLGAALQHNQLLPQGHDLKPQVRTRPNAASQPSEQHQYQPEHEFDFISTPAPKLLRCSHQQHFGDVHRLVSRSVFAALKIKHLNDWL